MIEFFYSRAAMVGGYCAKGDLQDILFNEKFVVDDNLKYSLSLDIAAGLKFLHSKRICHGMNF